MEIIDVLPNGSLANEAWIFLILFSALIFSKINSRFIKTLFLIILSILFALAINSYSFKVLSAFVIAIIFNFIFYKFLIKMKFILYISIIFNLALLFFAKYYLFTLDIFDFDPLSNDFNKLFLFTGVSFFVFSMIATLVESAKLKETNVAFFDFFMYAIFFPKILMGPIMTLKEFCMSYEKPNEISQKLGIFLFMFGFAKKTLADFLYLYPSLVFANPEGYSGSVHILSILGYAAQLYLDFSGYTLMAIGLALLFGYKLPDNFNRPYLSHSITEFWQKWHITLSAWLKNHVYIPLGGSRYGIARLYLALFLTFVASGIWHGVGLNYLLWGVWHGIGIIAHKTWKLLGFSMHTILAWFVTFCFVCFGWILFIYTDLKNIFSVFALLLNDFNVEVIPSVFFANIGWTCVFFISWVFILFPTKTVHKIEQLVFNANLFFQFLIVMIVLYASIYVKTIVVAPFIYESF